MPSGRIWPLSVCAAILCLTASCGPAGSGGSALESAGVPLEGDARLIEAAKTLSDALGGCVQPANATHTSRVVGLADSAIVMIACGEDAYSYSDRLFAVTAGSSPRLISVPDYDASGWIAMDQVSMAELDAGTGVLTTERKSSGDGACGSEGRYQWDGRTFALEELRWQACSEGQGGPPFPLVWPTQTVASVDPGEVTPAP